MDALALACSAIGIAAIALLAWLDPKRRRALRRSSPVRWLRLLLVATLLAPGIALIAHHRLATFIVWLGLMCFAGWAAAYAVKLNPSKQE